MKFIPQFVKILELNKKNYKGAIESSKNFLAKGESIVIPTDTIYGMACDALNEKAVENLLKIKERDRQKGLPIFVNSIEMARRLAYIDRRKEEFLHKIWPGQVTVVVYAKDVIPRIATGGRETVALRMPDYKFIFDLITAFSHPIIGTSANISGNEPIRSAQEAAKLWKNEAPTSKLVGIKRSSSEAEYRSKYILLRQGFEGLFSSPCLLRRSSRFGYEGRTSDQHAGRYSAKENKKIAPALIIDDGEIANTEPSTIVDITGSSPIILRSGIISKNELDKLFYTTYN